LKCSELSLSAKHIAPHGDDEHLRLISIYRQHVLIGARNYAISLLLIDDCSKLATPDGAQRFY